MNLSTARSEKRAKEVGIRKVVGAQKKSLIGQFIGESILLSFLAGIIAIIIVELVLPSFNLLVQKELFINFSNPVFWLVAISFIVFTGILAGSYPAFFLSSFQPVKVLKGTFRSAQSAVNPRKVLVVVQFTFAIALIISTIIVEHQIKYAEERDAGYSKDQLIYVPIEGEIDKHYDLIKNDLLNTGAATAVTKSMSPITQRYSDGWGWTWEGSTEADKKTDFIRMASDADFIKTMGAKLVAGRDIDIKNYPGDSTSMLLNETAVKAMHFKKPVGQIVHADDKDWTVVGVVKDFIYASPYEKIDPLAIMGPKSWFNTIHFKLNSANSTEKDLQLAENVFKKYNPQYPFDYHFVDEEYAKKFGEEKRTGTLAALFAGLTIFISCLGLFGLATYMAENRIKEIGVRKVLGASVTSITTLLSKDFLKLVIISFLIAAPIAWWAMNSWLQSYTYRISIQWWVFALAGILSVIIAILTVSYQAIKAAIANPVKSLRSE
jgi:ABC-type antimicrobial peptide transport system permease subunit